MNDTYNRHRSYRGSAVQVDGRLVMKHFIAGSLASLILVSLCVAQNSSPDSNPGTSTASHLVLSPADKYKVIYVQDFELDATNFKQDKGGITGKGTILPPPPQKLPTLRRKRQDPATAARRLVTLMSESLVSDLTKAGLSARRLLPGDAPPAEGLLVSGVFTETDEGNQMRRALLGFGSGAAKMELYVTVADLSHPAQSRYEVSTQKSSGKKPGAVITLNPYVGVAKLALTKNAPEKTVKKAAAMIAAELTKQLNGEELAGKN